MDTFFNLIDQLIKTLSQIGWVFTLVAGYLLARWQFKFESIHKRRFEIIEEAYAKLKLANRSFKNLTSPLQEGSDLKEEGRKKEKDFTERANDMFAYLDTKRIFFDTEERKHIDIITEKFFETWNNFRYKKDIEDEPSQQKERTRLYQEIWDSTSKEIPELISSLEEVFKKALGLK